MRSAPAGCLTPLGWDGTVSAIAQYDDLTFVVMKVN